MARVSFFFYIVILCVDGWGTWVCVVMDNHSVCVFEKRKKKGGR